MNLKEITRNVVRQFNRYSPVNIWRPDKLTRLANRCGSDKGTDYKLGHFYTRIYSDLFRSMREMPIVFLEMGLGRVDQVRRHGDDAGEGSSHLKAFYSPSLKMWREYFPKAKLVGFDIDDFTAVQIDNCRIFQGDMSSRGNLEALATDVGSPIDVIIDDASHVSHHQQIALATLFKHVVPGGIYVIEDLHRQFAPFEKEGVTKTRDMLRSFIATGSIKSEEMSLSEQRYLESAIASVELFDSMEGPDALAVIRKRTSNESSPQDRIPS